MPTLNCSLQGPAHGPVTGPVPTSNSHSNARQVALKILSTSSSTSTKSSSLISSLQSPSDRNLCTNLVQTANRREGQIDDIIQRHAKKRPKKVVLAALKLGIVQMKFLDTPPHAAIYETLEALKTFPSVSKPQVSFVNAVLRSASNSTSPLSPSTSNLSPHISSTLSSDWGSSVMSEVAEVYSLHDGGVTLSCTDVDVVGEMFRTHNVTNEISPLGSVGVKNPGSIKKLPGFDEGLWWVQDSSASLPAILLKNSIERIKKEGETVRVVDVCSAPGGKAMQMGSWGWEVEGVELKEKRAKRMRENIERTRLQNKVTVTVADAKTFQPSLPPLGFLLDAPCTATGTGRKNVDVMRRSEAEGKKMEEELVNTTVGIWENAKHWGSKVCVFSVCSLSVREGESQVDTFLRMGGVEIDRIMPEEVPGFEGSIDEQGRLRIFPSDRGDGFFITRFIFV
ncbi:hypothetical protein TrST_g420 [Triparma strigata]|nr:hypothetical protein TrST_g420 [Triparma strigata]